MKKFISLVAVATLLISAVSCREMEEISNVSENQNLRLSAKVKKDSVEVNSTSENTTTVENLPKDPPDKDGHNW